MIDNIIELFVYVITLFIKNFTFTFVFGIKVIFMFVYGRYFIDLDIQ